MIHLWIRFTYLVRIAYFIDARVYVSQVVDKHHIFYRLYVFGSVSSEFVYGCCLVNSHHGFSVGDFRRSLEKVPKTRVTKNQVLVVMDTPRKFSYFFEFVSMLVKLSEKKFVGNPWSVNNVQHFAKKRISGKTDPSISHILYIFDFFVLHERDTWNNFFLFLFLVTRDIVKKHFKSCAPFAHIAHFKASMISILHVRMDYDRYVAQGPPRKAFLVIQSKRLVSSKRKKILGHSRKACNFLLLQTSLLHCINEGSIDRFGICGNDRFNTGNVDCSIINLNMKITLWNILTWVESNVFPMTQIFFEFTL